MTPDQKTATGMDVGSSFVIPTAGWAATNGIGQFQLRLSPARIPMGYLAKDGQVNIAILGWTSTSIGISFASIHLGSSDSRAASLKAKVKDIASAHVIASQPLARNGTNAIGRAAQSSENDSEVSPDYGCAGHLARTYDVWTEFAETYPYLYNTTAWADFSAGHSVTTGVAVSPGGWHTSGSQTTSMGFTQDWDPSTAVRDYLVEIKYGEYVYTCFGYVFSPIEPLAGNATNDIGYQRWTDYCSPQSAGHTFTREKTTGHDFYLSGGVDASGIIGIDLSIDNAYSSSASMSYHFTEWSELAGNDDDPAYASRVTDLGQYTSGC